MATRVGREYINISNALNLLLGGTAVVYYGEEIGMDNLPEKELTFEACKDQRGIQQGVSFKINIHSIILSFIDLINF
jgi:glycosidase